MAKEIDPEIKADNEYLLGTAEQLETALRGDPDAVVTRSDVLQILAGLCRRVAELQVLAAGSDRLFEKTVALAAEQTELLGVLAGVPSSPAAPALSVVHSDDNPSTD